MEPIEKFFASSKLTNSCDWSTQTKDELIYHLKKVYYHRASNRVPF